MLKHNASSKSQEKRVQGFCAIPLGLNKKEAQDEARRCPQCVQAPCASGCPLGVDIPGFIRLLREGNPSLALERIYQENPFAAICGRICTAPCVEACVFYENGHPIAVRALECFAADTGTIKIKKHQSKSYLKRVAVIGSGPAGMSVAHYLAQKAIGVTIFEAAHEPGGLLRYAIPAFRLPQRIVDAEFDRLKSLGVDIRTGVVLGRTTMIEEIFMQGFEAVVIATGASLPLWQDIPGSSVAGVYYAMEFLYRLQATGKDLVLEEARRQRIAPRTVVVIGSGSPAFDAARLALRLGSQTHIVFNGFEEESGVEPEIRAQAQKEGVHWHSAEVLTILADGQGWVKGVECRPLDIVETKEGLKLVVSKEDPFILEASAVVIASGQRPNDSLKQSLPRLQCSQDGFIQTDPKTGQTNIDKVFACGSAVSGGGSVVEAMASGKKVAGQIIQLLENDEILS